MLIFCVCVCLSEIVVRPVIGPFNGASKMMYLSVVAAVMIYSVHKTLQTESTRYRLNSHHLAQAFNLTTWHELMMHMTAGELLT